MFDPDPDVQSVIDVLKASDQSEDEILEVLLNDLELSEEHALEELEANDA